MRINGMGKLGFVFDRALEVMAILASLVLIFVIVIVVADALGRYFFGFYIIWVTLISEYSLLYITFLGGAWLLREEKHVSVELVTDHLGKRTQAMLGIITSLIGVIVYTFLFSYGMIVTVDHFQRGIYDPGILRFPKAPVILIIPIGSFFLVVQFLRRAWNRYRLLKRTGSDLGAKGALNG